MPDTLLAVDLGLKTGLALYTRDGRLAWYRSRNYGSRARLKKATYAVLNEAEGVQVVVIEGGQQLAQPWINEAERRDLTVMHLAAEQWRAELMIARHQRNGKDAKKHADVLARRIIDWSGAKRPTSLRHDAAEAICIGLWGMLRAGWLDRLPAELRF